MANIAEYCDQLQKLTKQNLEILKSINDSFYTKREHLMVQVGDANYAIPSFLSLENKINALQENFNNLVYAPKTGEAYFNVDGNSRSIEVKGYTATPNRLTIDTKDITGFDVEQNDVFKDFLTPNPFVHLDLQSIPNDISTVNVRKVSPKSKLLENTLTDIMNESGAANERGIVPLEWSRLYKILSIYREDDDYTQYDTVRQLPIRKNIGSGEYVIKSIDKDYIDDELDEYLTLTFHQDLKYKLFDETIERYLAVGDCLVTYDDSAKMQIVEVNAPARKVTVKVLNGDYLNLVADADGGLSSDMCKLKFFSPVDYDLDKYINIPLEEDRYVCIFVAPLNNRMNVQAPWGSGILIDTNVLKWNQDGSTSFKSYYDNNVRNIGDILYEISSAMTATIMKYSEEDFISFSQYHPTIDTSKLKVVQINNHLNNSETAKNIRNLYAQKQEYNRQLSEVQNRINEVNKMLAEVSFSDTTGVRSAYESQLNQYNASRNELTTSIIKIVNEIAIAANESVIPIENAKYRIRGYFDWYVTDEAKDVVLSKYWQHVHGIKVQYRYKNQDNDAGNALSIDDKFVFSDWNDMAAPVLQRIPAYAGGYKFKYPQYNIKSENGEIFTHDNGQWNEPSFNQIDIPITQGESVDIRLKVIWDFGYPFIESTSDWSPVVNIQFPDELIKDVQLLDIVEENNDDIETNRFKNILEENGVNKHVNDKLMDQDVLFFHKPENISSGFYTPERRVIPLRDKLLEINNKIVYLEDLVNETNSNGITCKLIVDNTDYEISPDKRNVITLPAYQSTKEFNENVPHLEQVTIQLLNNTQHTVHLYSIFPYRNDVEINQILNYKYPISDYITTKGGVPLVYYTREENESGIAGIGASLQTANQWITFRTKDLYDGAAYYASGESNKNPDNVEDLFDLIKGSTNFIVYPYLTDKDMLKMNGSYNKIVLNPGESKIIPIQTKYFIGNNTNEIRSIAFDLRLSLYNDPVNYTIELHANYADTVQEKLAKSERNRLVNRSTLTAADAIYQSIIKND